MNLVFLLCIYFCCYQSAVIDFPIFAYDKLPPPKHFFSTTIDFARRARENTNKIAYATRKFEPYQSRARMNELTTPL
jgi:hypothetical protein